MATAEKYRWVNTVLGVQVPAPDPTSGTTAEPRSSGGSGLIDRVKQWIKPKKPVPRADLGPAQQSRADKALAAMAPDDQAKVKQLLDNAPPEIKKYLTKAVSSKHSAAEITAFANKIAGKDQKWLNENLHLVGLAHGKGIKQQWSDSCAPTTVQAMMGELDPLYALKLHEQNKDLTDADDDDGKKLNARMAAEQKAILESHGGTAAPRDGEKAAAGQGMGMSDTLNETTDATGLEFEMEPVKDEAAMTKGLDDAAAALKGGLPVPIRVGGDDPDAGHAVLMTGVDAGPPRRFSFHDPWEGETLIFTEDQIKKNDINIAGWKKLTIIYKPSPAKEA